MTQTSAYPIFVYLTRNDFLEVLRDLRVPILTKPKHQKSDFFQEGIKRSLGTRSTLCPYNVETSHYTSLSCKPLFASRKQELLWLTLNILIH
jgi:hypothetical protein